ncbi:hypothetical protein ACU4GD_24340 [Cupriavidus basilensis]
MVWKFVFPQPYESLTLRLVAMVMCLPLIVSRDLRGHKVATDALLDDADVRAVVFLRFTCI